MLSTLRQKYFTSAPAASACGEPTLGIAVNQRQSVAADKWGIRLAETTGGWRPRVGIVCQKLHLLGFDQRLQAPSTM